MNPAYLHPPITTADKVRALLPSGERPGTAESLTLDFKAMPWGHKTKKGRDSEVEFASDVAAMLNADGGSLVVGVSETAGGRAAELSGLPGVDWRSTRQALEQWLRNRLDPRDAETFVHVPAEPIEVDGKPVYVVEVAPCPFGPVAVLDGRNVLIPLRRGAETTHLTFSEAVRSMNVHARARFLELRAFCDGGQKQVRIDAGMFIKFHDQADLVPVVTGPRLATATIAELTPDAVELELVKSHVDQALYAPAYVRARRLAADWARRERMGEAQAEDYATDQMRGTNAVITNGNRMGQTFRIPLSEVRAVVREKSTQGGAPAGLLLSLKLVFHLSRDAGHWTITT